MHKFSIYLVSFTLLFQSFSIEITDISGIPSLISHMISHANDGDNILDFLSKHYGIYSNSHQNEHKEHNDLPFKHTNFNSHFQPVYTFFLNNFTFSITEELSRVDKFDYTELILCSYLDTILQPPKIA
jgi:hypothetical protein